MVLYQFFGKLAKHFGENLEMSYMYADLFETMLKSLRSMRESSLLLGKTSFCETVWKLKS